MSLQLAAEHLASKGRHGDSMLVHMTPGEVRGLQALAMAHGGSLSINPDTGLVEANFLKKILPTLLGIGLSFMGVPTWAIGLGTGAVETARTGDLGKGILAGLGAYGGASIGSSLFGGNAVFDAAASQAGPSVSAVSPGAAPSITPIAGGALPPPPAPAVLGQGANFTPDVGRSLLSNAPPVPSVAPPAPSAPGFLSKAGDVYMKAFDKSPIPTALMTVGGISALMPPKGPEKEDEEKYYADFQRSFGYDPRTKNYMAASGGSMDMLETEPGERQFAGGGVPIKQGSFIMPARETAEFGNGSSSAGLAALSKLGARPIYGPGDGVSDSIRANIGGVQEARLAREEAYFPPEAVAKIGKGNHKKGTQKLYSMMKAAQQARKKADRGQDTGLKGMLPA